MTFRATIEIWVWLAVLACVPRGASAQSGTSPCVFTSPPKSAIAWQSGLAETHALAREELAGRVVWVHNGEPVRQARILVRPNTRYVLSDSAGRFTMRGLPQGRYFVQIGTFGAIEAADSITVGFDGVQIVAALSHYTGHIACSLPAREPSNER